MHEEGNPFLGDGLIRGTATAQFRGAVRETHQAGMTESGDDVFVPGALNSCNSVLHASHFISQVRHGMSEWMFYFVLKRDENE